MAFEVARALGAPLDVLVVRKLGVPFQPELGMGAVGEGGVRVLNPDVLRQARVTEAQLAEVEARERAAVEERATRLRRGRPAIPLEGRTVVIVDDGLATGGTARAAVRVARARGAERVVLAVPVAPPETVASLLGDADDVIAVETPEPFFAIGGWYTDFSPTSDREVVELLTASEKTSSAVDRSRRSNRRGNRDPRTAPAPAWSPDDPCRCHRDRGVRARQRQQPAQPPQPARGAGCCTTPVSARCCSIS